MTHRRQVRELMTAARVGRAAELRVRTGAPLPGDDQRIQAGMEAEGALNRVGLTARSRRGGVPARPRRIA